jgi:chorismate dehydratase
MKKYKISAVSYSNTWPFIYGLKKANLPVELNLEMPSMCARKFKNNEADIALVPVGALPNLTDYKIFSDYCIGALNKVRTVTLMSQVPISEIKEIVLDYQSNTSVKLVQLLANKYWKIFPTYKNAEIGFENEIKDTSAAVIIGDRVFEQEQKVKYIYDLSEHWYNWKKLPFAFAVWIAKNDTPKEILDNINKALSFGVNNIEASIENNWSENNNLSKPVVKEYLTKNIKYNLNETIEESIRIFLKEQEQSSTI